MRCHGSSSRNKSKSSDIRVLAVGENREDEEVRSMQRGSRIWTGPQRQQAMRRLMTNREVGGECLLTEEVSAGPDGTVGGMEWGGGHTGPLFV